ncbi:hypothetical protein ACFLSJ_01720 [Verrucomicrobiota bacterium]
MKQPEPEKRSNPERHRQRLGRWLAEWQIEQAIAAGEETHPRKSRGDNARTVAGDRPGVCAVPDSEIRVGQIRLLAPETPTTRLRPVHVAILEEDEAGLLVAPFGRFAEPALPGEMATNRRTAPLRVLCLWNARRVDKRTLRTSWVVDELSDDERDEALSVHHGLTSHSPLPAGLERKLGPPLLHPDDPRQVYFHRETVRMDRIVREMQSAAAPGRPDIYPERQDGETRKAAESRSQYEAQPDEDEARESGETGEP